MTELARRLSLPAVVMTCLRYLPSNLGIGTAGRQSFAGLPVFGSTA